MKNRNSTEHIGKLIPEAMATLNQTREKLIILILSDRHVPGNDAMMSLMGTLCKLVKHYIYGSGSCIKSWISGSSSERTTTHLATYDDAPRFCSDWNQMANLDTDLWQ